ncbi:MAG: methyl-accepting chemotaxis protein, partial [Alphaproteobacteria bacterium]|nr:methyl-accepting chemotaxis protein [Alphaproteobacteria bacterium]
MSTARSTATRWPIRTACGSISTSAASVGSSTRPGTSSGCWVSIRPVTAGASSPSPARATFDCIVASSGRGSKRLTPCHGFLKTCAVPVACLSCRFEGVALRASRTRSDFSCLSLSSLPARLAGIVAVPVIGFIVLVGAFAHSQWRSSAEMRHLDALGEFTTVVANLVHELQKERGMSAVFINSEGKQLVAELPQQRRATDERIGTLREKLKKLDLSAYPTSIRISVEHGVEALTPLAQRREVILARSIRGTESNQFFSATIAELLAIAREAVKASNDPAITAALLTKYSYSWAKERSGQERASGAVGFAAGKFSSDQLRTYTTIVADQRAFFHAFESYASPTQRTFVRENVAGPIVEEVERMRKLALETPAEQPLTGVTGAAWFNATTARIDLMKRVEDRLGADLRSITGEILARDVQAFWYSVVAGIAGLVIAIAMTWLLGRGLLRPLSGLITTIRGLAEGKLDLEIPSLCRKDELGQLATAMQVFKDNMSETARLRADQEASAARATMEKAAAMNALADRFQSSVGGIAGAVSAAAAELQASAQQLQATSEQTSGRASAVASASEEASTNV